MKKILVATDFSERSDRAIRRGVLLAKQSGASIVLVHAVDDDLPRRVVDADRDAALELLDEQARSLREIDGVDCDSSVVLGDPFEGLTKASESIAPDLLVVGPHRRQTLKDIFVGTTAERTIRTSRRPVMMANAMPARSHRRLLVAVDFSDSARAALDTVTRLGLHADGALSILHVFDTIGPGFRARASISDDQAQQHMADGAERAAAELASFLDGFDVEPQQTLVRHRMGTIAHTVGEVAQELAADLIVVGTHGRSGLAKVLLGSVAEGVLRTATCDVLAVPTQAA